jgi:IMP dehydrogenase/GMP reductase
MLYNLDEICLIPTPQTSVDSRDDVTIYTNKNRYPLFTAPMSCIVDETNYKLFESNRINTIIPRSVDWNTRFELIKDGQWVSVGLKEAEYIYDNTVICNEIRLCIDQANGHMIKLLNVCKNLKDKYGHRIHIMTGNIANPQTYRDYARVGVDYVRIGIGGGSVCTTSVQTGVHYPMASLIVGCVEQRRKIKEEMSYGGQYRTVPKIVADGGIKRIDHIIKALALGADYVMLGEILATCDLTNGTQLGKFKKYYGMSTVKAQQLINNASLFKVEDFKPKHSEGVYKDVEVIHKISDWTNDFEHAIRSCMSYVDALNLNEFKGQVNWDTMSKSSFCHYNK